MNLAFRPELAEFVGLQHDDTRGRWLLQTPERVLVLEETGKAMVGRFDGKTSLVEIFDALVREYGAPREVIEHDVSAVAGLLDIKLRSAR